MAYTSSSFKVSRSQLEYINSLVILFNQPTQELFKHILASTVIGLSKDKLSVPVSSRFIDNKFRGASWIALKSENLIEVSEYEFSLWGPGKSREYAVSTEPFKIFCDLHNDDEPQVNLYTGEVIKNAKLANVLLDENKNEVSSLITNAVSMIAYNYINLPEVEDILAALLDEREYAWEDYQADTPNKELKARYVAINARWYNVQYALSGIKNAGLTTTSFPNIFKYNQAWEYQSTGRIGNRGGGAQNFPRIAKQAAYHTIPNLYNYDLKSSQVYGLIQQFEEANARDLNLNLSTAWLKDYLNSEKQEYADRVGVDIHTWKTLICSTMMGSKKSLAGRIIKGELRNYKDPLPTLLKVLQDYFTEARFEKIAEGFTKYCNVTKNLQAQIDKWQEHLEKEMSGEFKSTLSYSYKGSTYTKNAADVKLNCTKLQKEKNNDAYKSYLAAFFLQGQESAFIHRLTTLSTKYKFIVLSNEHDGLITINTIPNEAIEEAKQLSGLKYATLVIKPFI